MLAKGEKLYLKYIWPEKFCLLHQGPAGAYVYPSYEPAQPPPAVLHATGLRGH